MSNNKTVENDNSVEEFLYTIENKRKRNDAIAIDNILEKITKSKAKMWGPSIIGYGKYHYEYNSGRKGEFMKIGYAPRKTNFSFYIMDGISNYNELLKKLGKHKLSKTCLYINKLEDIDRAILIELLSKSWKSMTKKYG